MKTTFTTNKEKFEPTMEHVFDAHESCSGKHTQMLHLLQSGGGAYEVIGVGST